VNISWCIGLVLSWFSYSSVGSMMYIGISVNMNLVVKFVVFVLFLIIRVSSSR